MNATHTPTLTDVGVDSELVENNSSQRYFTISATVGSFDCVLLDTLNCHHCLTEEEQQSIAEEFTRRYKSYAALSKHNEALREALDEALEYFEDREDVRDGPSGEQLPNTEMSMAQALRAALALSRVGGT